MGAVLYECLAGRPAFTGDQPATVVHRALNEAPASIDHTPAALGALATRTLSKDPVGRPGSAREFLEQLMEAARRSYGDDWLSRAGVAALAGALGVGTIAAVEAAGAGGAPALATSASHAASSIGTAANQFASAATSAPQTAPSKAIKSARFARTVAAHKAVAGVVTAIVVVGVVAGAVAALQSSPASIRRPIAVHRSVATSPPATVPLIASWTTGPKLSTTALGASGTAYMYSTSKSKT